MFGQRLYRISPALKVPSHSIPGERENNEPPKTLLQMAGADLTPNALTEYALVLIDYQMEYVSGAVPLGGVERALEEAGRVLTRAREADAPIAHIVHKGQAGGVFDLDGAGGQIAPQVAQGGG